MAILIRPTRAVIVAVTIFTIWQTTLWWVRLCDFPRYQVARWLLMRSSRCRLHLGPLAVAELSSPSRLGWRPCGRWRGYGVIFPALRLKSPTAPRPRGNRSASPFYDERIPGLSRRRRRCKSSATQIRPNPPVETDEWWCSRLSEALRSRYQYGLTYPLSNGYGMAIFSRLELLQPTISFLVDEAIPSIKTGVRLRSGAVIDLYGLHPQPPAPLRTRPSETLS